LSADLGVPHIATGDLLRDQVSAGTRIGLEAKAYMDRGDYVPDGVMVEMIRRRLAEADAEKGFILDGYPRTQIQAKELDKLLADLDVTLDAVLVLEVPIDEIVERLSARRTCPKCQRAYHMRDDPPADDERCDDDATPLERRTDDEPETVRYRLKVYEDRVDGNAGVEEVTKRIDEALGI
jgi:adenylate kinase